MKRFLVLVISCLLLASCTTVYKTAVTLSDAEDAAMKEWARAHNDHQTTRELDLRVMAAHAKFNDAKLVAVTALRTYKASGDKAAFEMSLEVLRATVPPLLDLIASVSSPTKVQSLRTQVNLANAP